MFITPAADFFFIAGKEKKKTKKRKKKPAGISITSTAAVCCVCCQDDDDDDDDLPIELDRCWTSPVIAGGSTILVTVFSHAIRLHPRVWIHFWRHDNKERPRNLHDVRETFRLVQSNKAIQLETRMIPALKSLSSRWNNPYPFGCHLAHFSSQLPTFYLHRLRRTMSPSQASLRRRSLTGLLDLEPHHR